MMHELQQRLRLGQIEFAAAGACVVVIVVMSAMVIARVVTLHSSFFDLGSYTTYHHAIAFGWDFSLLFRTHAHLLAAPYALLFRLIPGGLTLVLLQTAMILFGGVLYVRYWQRLRLPWAAVAALLYCLSLPVWFNALFDFHFDHLAFPIIIGFFLLMERPASGLTKALAVTLGLLLCGVKETFALSAAMLGLYLVLAKRWRFAGVALSALSLAYFFVVTQFAIPHFSGGAASGELWQSGFGYLGTSPAEIVLAVLRRPWVVAHEVFGTPRKLLYFVLLLSPLAFLPVFRPLMLFPALPPLGISLLSHNPNHYFIGHQYSALVAATFLVAAASALSRWQSRYQFRWITVMLVMTALCQVAFGPSPVSRLFWSPNVFNYHWTAYWLDAHDRALEEAIDRLIPRDDNVAVSAQNAVNSDRLSNRSFAFAYPDGVSAAADVFVPSALQLGVDRSAAKTGRERLADFVVLDRKRPLAFGDDICPYRRDVTCDDRSFVARFETAIQALSINFTILYDQDGIMIAKRR